MLQVFSITQVAQVGQEVHKSITADIHEEIDRERELELIQECIAAYICIQLNCLLS